MFWTIQVRSTQIYINFQLISVCFCNRGLLECIFVFVFQDCILFAKSVFAFQNGIVLLKVYAFLY